VSFQLKTPQIPGCFDYHDEDNDPKTGLFCFIYFIWTWLECYKLSRGDYFELILN